MVATAREDAARGDTALLDNLLAAVRGETHDSAMPGDRSESRIAASRWMLGGQPVGRSARDARQPRPAVDMPVGELLSLIGLPQSRTTPPKPPAARPAPSAEQVFTEALERRCRADPLIASYHEAGHAVVGHRLGLKVVELRRDVGTGGECRFDHWQIAATEPWRHAMVALAGQVAERMAPGWVAGMERFSGDDRDIARSLVGEAELPALTEQVTETLSHWRRRGQLERLAVELERHSVLSGERVAAILADRPTGWHAGQRARSGRLKAI